MKGMRKLESPKGRGCSTRHSNKLQHLYKVSKCRECSVDVIRMDFQKMMGGFTKVKIQYDNNDAISSPPRSRVRTRKGSVPEDINIATRLRSNENGMVLIHRKAYNKHPVKSVANKNETKNNSNVLKERNSQLSKKALEMLAKSRKSINVNGAPPSPRRSSFKQYYLVFTEPKGVENVLSKTKSVVFKDVLLKINKSILPTNDWVVEFLPAQKNEQDVVYDRIAAELEDLMPSEKSPIKDSSNATMEIDARSKPPEDFPSIMDILNEEPMSVDPDKPILKSEDEPRTNNIQASDIEAMLTGSSDIDNTSTLGVDSTSANGNNKVSTKKSAHGKTNLLTDEVTKNKNILPTDEIMKEESKQDYDLKDIDIVIKNESESVKVNVLQDEEMDVDDNEKESDISAKETVNSNEENSESTSVKETNNSVEEEDASNKNLDKEATTLKLDGAVSCNSEAIEKELASTKPTIAVEPKQKNINLENSFESIDLKLKEQNKMIEFIDSAEEIKSPKKEDNKMEINGMESENDTGIVKVEDEEEEKMTPTVPDIKEAKMKITQHENLSYIIPEYYNSESVTHISFKHPTGNKDSKSKTVTFHKSFDYDIEIEGKKVQLLGAPDSINDIEDLKVLLQIVNETSLNSFNIVH